MSDSFIHVVIQWLFCVAIQSQRLLEMTLGAITPKGDRAPRRDSVSAVSAERGRRPLLEDEIGPVRDLFRRMP
jgi:hypothetical protein